MTLPGDKHGEVNWGEPTQLWDGRWVRYGTSTGVTVPQPPSAETHWRDLYIAERNAKWELQKQLAQSASAALSNLAAAVRDFLAILDIEEESDSGNRFRPNYINSCRVMDGQRLGTLLARMKELSARTETAAIGIVGPDGRGVANGANATQRAEAERIKGGVAFIMGPGGDEGTRQCTCNTYPHLDWCGGPDGA